MNERDEQLLERVLTGDVARDAPEWRAALSRDRELLQRWTELQRIERELGHAGDDEQEAIARARAATTDRDRAAVSAAIASSRSRTSRRAWLRAAAAAVIVLCVGAGIWWAGRERQPIRPIENLGSRPRDLSPNGAVKVIDEFRWECELPRGGWFEVVVFERNGDGSPGEELVRLPAWYENSWRPSDEQKSRIQRPIIWRVFAHGPSTGSPVEHAEASASISSQH